MMMADQSEYQKFMEMIAVYEKILHPDIFYPLQKQMHKVYEESLANAYKNANISDEALKIEGIIKDMIKFSKINTDGKPTLFNYKSAFKQILTIFRTKR